MALRPRKNRLPKRRQVSADIVICLIWRVNLANVKRGQSIQGCRNSAKAMCHRGDYSSKWQADHQLVCNELCSIDHQE